MTVDRKDFLSFLIKPSGEVVPAMPHEEEFSAQQIWDQVAGYPELICETCDGFLLFRDRDASAKGLPFNPLATSVYMKYARRPSPVNGRVFLPILPTSRPTGAESFTRTQCVGDELRDRTRWEGVKKGHCKCS